MRSLIIFQLSAAVFLAACGRSSPYFEDARNPAQEVRRRASADFDCAEPNVQTKTIDDRTRVASGCGQQGTYVEICERCIDTATQVFGGAGNTYRCKCTWSLDATRSRPH